MGRKHQSKHNEKENKIHQQKRKELTNLVQKLLNLTTVFFGATNQNKLWDHHKEIIPLTKEIMSYEHSSYKEQKKSRDENIEKYVMWLKEHEVEFEGLEIASFEDYEYGLKALKSFPEDSLLLTIPKQVMMTEIDAQKSDLSEFIKDDVLMQNMPNVTLALFLLFEKSKSDSFWKPYIDTLPESYSTVLYFDLEELAELKPSPTFESSMKLYTNIARQYSYLWLRINKSNQPGLKNLKEIFTFENYRWAVSTVMTRQNHIQLTDFTTTAFIPLWDMCNHEQGKISTDFNKDGNRGECYAKRDFKPGEQVFIFYGARPNADLFVHNGFVYPNNDYDYITLTMGVSSSDALRELKMSLLTKLGLNNVTQYRLYKKGTIIMPELLAFIRIFNMNKDELEKWSKSGLPSDLVSSDESSAKEVGCDIDARAYNYLLTRCNILISAYKKLEVKDADTQNRKNIKLLKECEVQILEDAIEYINKTIEQFKPIA
ncbi:actin-histidine N-methyltransferase [Pieris brassicae]|uniref:actin-histidine N-methyltransferase n=1 Tax=Pieris brassicae TaxID=7116 RepID=UPI001E65FE51|nr:actin-histidine N-methyltransferase [Pieris brassicae]